LQGAYFILAARAWAWTPGPMSGLTSAKVDQLFENSSWKSNFLCNIGYGDAAKKLHRAVRALALTKPASLHKELRPDRSPDHLHASKPGGPEVGGGHQSRFHRELIMNKHTHSVATSSLLMERFFL